MKRQLLHVLAASLLAPLSLPPALAQNANAKPGAGGPPNVSVLPYPDPVFKGVIGRTTEDSKSDFPQPVKAPAGAPNILVILTDDVGFGASSTFGGPVPTRPPNERICADRAAPRDAALL
jgi:hypothetical protein